MMKPRVLKTEADYEAALACLETLMDAAPGSPEEEALEVFALLIEAYEQVHYPIAPPYPPRYLRCYHCHKQSFFSYVRDAARGGWQLYRCRQCGHERYVERETDGCCVHVHCEEERCLKPQ